MDRRQFVKGSVATAAAAAIASGSLAGARAIVEPRPAPRPPVPYFGLHKVGGPAPRGLPLVPVFVNAEGVFEGRSVLEGVPVGSALAPAPDGRVDVLAWYRYCGHQGSPALRHERAADARLRDAAGSAMRPADVPVGKAVAFTWRSDGLSGADVLGGVLMHRPPGAVVAHEGRRVPPAQAIRGADRALLARFVVEGPDGVFVASSTFCTHFCCTPAWWEQNAAQARAKGAEGEVFCTCHDSRYDPNEIVLYSFAPEA